MSKWSAGGICPALGGVSAATVVLIFTVSPSFAAVRHPEGSRQAQEKAARKACLTGDYSAGVSILADLFVDNNNPVYVFNQGRCLEQNARYKDAIVRFEEYLRLGETTKLESNDRSAAEKHIEDCKAKLAEEEKKAQAVEPQPAVQPIPQPSPQPLQQPDGAAQTVENVKTDAAPPKSGHGLIVGGIVTGAVGAAGVVAGVVFNLKANGLVDEMESNMDAYTSSKSSSRKSYETLGWIGYGVGAACIATGAVLIGVGVSRGGSAAQTSVAVMPTFSPGQAGVLLRGGF
jgi:hypothetical protein